MALQVTSLFGNRQDQGFRHEEGTVVPDVSPGEVVFFARTGGYGEFSHVKNDVSFGLCDDPNDYRGQTFTSGVATYKADFTVKSVKFNMHRSGSPGVITCELKAVDSNGDPTGSVLASGTSDCDDLTTSTTGELREFVFSAPYVLDKDTEYAVYIYGASTDASNWVKISLSISGSYGTGSNVNGFVSSTDGGTTWSNPSNTDTYFEIHGIADYVLTNLFGTIRQLDIRT